MDYATAVKYLDDHVGAGVRPGLERIELLVETMGSPHTGYPTIHVAGTNGKTSTTRFGALVLLAHGLNTGTFTSPHLQRVEERFGINGREATPDEFAQAAADVAAFADILERRDGVHFTYFELTAAMAFAFFVDQAVEAAVVEVGLGGRLDATNIIDGDVAVVTSVGLDHTEYLGDTLEAIAIEKLAIAGPGSILVTGPLDADVATLADERARELGIEHRAFGRDFSVDSRPAPRGWEVAVQGAETSYPTFHLPVHGRHQTENVAVAVAAAEALLGRRLDPEALQEAAAAFTTPGRLEPVATEPLVMLDGAHNADGFKVLDAALAEEFPSIRWTLVVGIMADKDLESMVAGLAGRLEAVVVTSPPGERALPAADAARRIDPHLEAPVEVVDDPLAAVQRARQLAGTDGAVLVAGSLYLVGAVRGALVGNGRP